MPLVSQLFGLALVIRETLETRVKLIADLIQLVDWLTHSFYWVFNAIKMSWILQLFKNDLLNFSLGFCADKASKWHNYTEILYSTWQLDCSWSCYPNHEDYYCCKSEVIVNLYFLKSAMNIGPWISHHHRSLWAASYNSSNLFYISPNTHFALHSTSKMIIRLNWFSNFFQFRTSRSLGTLSTNFSKFALNKVTWMKDRLDVDLRHDAENFYNGSFIEEWRF